MVIGAGGPLKTPPLILLTIRLIVLIVVHPPWCQKKVSQCPGQLRLTCLVLGWLSPLYLQPWKFLPLLSVWRSLFNILVPPPPPRHRHPPPFLIPLRLQYGP